MSTGSVKLKFSVNIVEIIILLNILSAQGLEKKRWLNYILQWTPTEVIPFRQAENEHEIFVQNQCAFINCFVTNNKSYFNSTADFDVILFYGPDLILYPNLTLPQDRSEQQKYVFASVESAHNYPVSAKFNNYFNWTWTYKLNSDARFGYIAVRNRLGDVVGPKTNMHWISVDDMRPISKYVMYKLRHKKIAAAYFVSNCNTKSKREQFVSELETELIQYDLRLDIYGECGTLTCPVSNMVECLVKVRFDYYFYLAFENSFSEDFVTERLLHALHNYAVPIVYGGANYTRFMPDGMYLNARLLGPKKLAKQMHYIINDKKKYYDFFKWHNHYVYQDTRDKADTNEYCNFCVLINDFKRRTTRSVYLKLDEWWNEPSQKLDTEYHITSTSTASMTDINQEGVFLKTKDLSEHSFAYLLSSTVQLISKSYKDNSKAFLDLITQSVRNVLERNFNKTPGNRTVVVDNSN